MPTGIDPCVDYVFKRLCGDEDNARILVDILNSVIGFLAGVVVRGVTLLNPFVERDFAEGKVPILDVRARDDLGRQFLLEMQRIVREGFDNRLLYYWASGHAEQLLKGDYYQTLQPTYIICFLTEDLYKEGGYHRCFLVRDEQGVPLGKGLEIHLLQLNKFNVPVEEVKTPLERWCYFFKHGASLDLATLPATLDVPIIRRAVEILMQISQSELERQRFLERQRGEREAAAREAAYQNREEKLAAAEKEVAAAREKTEAAQKEAEAAQKEAEAAQEKTAAAQKEAEAAQEKTAAAHEQARLARQKGLDDGRAEGIEKGQLIGRIRLLQQFLRQTETSSDELRLLSEPDLLWMEESLKQLFSSKKNANGTPPADPT